MENPLCNYKDLIGKPRTGFHSYRFLGIAIGDTLVVIIAGLLFSYYTKYNVFLVLFVLFLSGVIFHRLFCVKSQIDMWLFPDE